MCEYYVCVHIYISATSKRIKTINYKLLNNYHDVSGSVLHIASRVTYKPFSVVLRHIVTIIVTMHLLPQELGNKFCEIVLVLRAQLLPPSVE